MLRRERRSVAGRRARVIVPGGAIGVALAMWGAVAFACTTSSTETTNVSPSSGTNGSALTVSTWTTGNQLARMTSGFYFRYITPAQVASSVDCHHATTIGSAESSDTNGDIASLVHVSRTIPNLGGMGTGHACWSTGNHVTNEISADTNITVN